MDLNIKTVNSNSNLSFKGLFEIQKQSAQILKDTKIDVSKFTDLKSFRKFFREILVSNRKQLLTEKDETIQKEFSAILNNPEIVKDWLKIH
jgi:hypothetical protein